MTESMRLILEIGKARKVVAAATDWPGLDRWGYTEQEAVDKLVSYLPRYAVVAERAGLADAFATGRGVDVIERVPGSSSTDFWGVAHVPSQTERQVLSTADLERRLRILEACWAEFDAVAARVPAELRPGSRSAGRSRDEIIRHVRQGEADQFSRKVDVRTPPEVVATPAGLAAHRLAFLGALRDYNDRVIPARSWPIQFLIRRVANHVMDHAWEMEDRGDPEG